MRFEWDENKNKSNIRKHKISFEEAKTVFDDPLARIFDDIFHSTDEIRYIIIGKSKFNKLILVVYTEKYNNDNNDIIRIISSRLCTKKEMRDYENFK